MNSLKYAATFEEKLLGAKCDVDVVVDVATGESTATIAMRQMLRSMPICRIGIETLEELLTAMKAVEASAILLEARPEGAQDHQLNFGFGGASLIVVQPPGKKARYVLTVGSFNKEGEVSQMSHQELADAVARVNALRKSVCDKVNALLRH